MTIDWRSAQGRLGVTQDGHFGPVSYTALLARVAGAPVASVYGVAAAAHIATYHVDDNSQRLAAFIGQCCHESGGFRYTREHWGPTADQRTYDAPGNSLGNRPGEGYRMRGAGWIEVTGRNNLTVIGKRLGLDLIGDPALLDDVDIGLRISLEWWAGNNMNAIADSRSTLAVSRAVNCGNADSHRQPRGADERELYTVRAQGVLV